MADPKQELIDRAIERLEQMQALLGQFIIAKSDEMDALGEMPGEEYQQEIMGKFADTDDALQDYMEELANEAVELGISPKDPDMKPVSQIIRDIFNMLSHPGDYAAKTRNRAKEPIDNLGSVDVKVLSKEEIENKLFALHDEQEAAISQTDKARIQHEIDSLLEMYKQSKFKSKFVK